MIFSGAIFLAWVASFAAASVTPRRLDDTNTALYFIDTPFAEATFQTIPPANSNAAIQVTFPHADTSVPQVGGVVVTYLQELCAAPTAGQFDALTDAVDLDAVVDTSSNTQTIVYIPLDVLQGIAGVSSNTITPSTSTTTTYEIDFCVRLGILTESGTTVANFRDLDISATGDLENGLVWTGSVDATPEGETAENLANDFGVSAFACDGSNTAISASLTQGDSVDICVQISEFPSASIVDMGEFVFTAGSVTQNAFNTNGDAQDLTTESTTLPCIGNTDLCKFTTILSAGFYQDDAGGNDGGTRTVVGSGVVQITLGTTNRRVLLSVGEVAGAALETEVEVNLVVDNCNCSGAGLFYILCWFFSCFLPNLL